VGRNFSTAFLIASALVLGGFGPPWSQTNAHAEAGPSAATQPVIRGAQAIPSGSSPQIEISGLGPRESVRIYSVRMFAVGGADPQGGWSPKPRPIIAWADAKADRRGRVDLGGANVRTGSWRGRDPTAILWSGVRQEDPRAPRPQGFDALALKEGEGVVLVERNGSIVARSPLQIVTPRGVEVIDVDQGPLNGAFAAPSGARRLPVIIILHGSEGGDRAEAREVAARYAGQGFAAFALNYFAWDFRNIPIIPNVHVNQPIEIIEGVRDWLRTRPEADVGRLGVFGVSKGAEFAAVAAVRYPWIRAVTACVGTDVVWEGYGLDDERSQRGRASRARPEKMSSWSWGGAPLDYIPLHNALPGEPGYFDNTERYERSRAENPAAAKAAEIPLELSPAKFLLLGGGRDEIWASGAMVTRLAERVREAGRARDVEAVVYPKAGHGICGDGAFPPRVWAEDSAGARKKDPYAEGQAAVDAWARTIGFFRRTL